VRVLVCGGRQFTDTTLLNTKLDELHAQYRFSVLIEGDAIGADRLAGEWADAHEIEHVKFIADWETYGSKAGPKRNRRMLTEGKPDLVVAFPGEHGTAHMVRISRAASVKVIEVG